MSHDTDDDNRTNCQFVSESRCSESNLKDLMGPLHKTISILNKTIADQDKRMTQLEKVHTEREAKLYSVISSLSKELNHLQLSSCESKTRSKNRKTSITELDDVNVNFTPERKNNLSHSSPYSIQQNTRTPLNMRRPKFMVGQQHREGWRHEFYEGMKVVLQPEEIKGTIVKETVKSVWVEVPGFAKPRLKRKSNIEPDLDDASNQI